MTVPVRIPPVLEVRDLRMSFPLARPLPWSPRRAVHAVDGVSFSVAAGETLGLVGESGCGKSTTGRAILRLIEPTGGEVLLDGEDLAGLSAARMRERRRDIQVVFQDPYSSLNPRMRARDLVAEPMLNFGAPSRREVDARVAELFEQVGLRPDQMSRFAHEFSGGQRQRLVIARALAPRPRLIVCDEAVSALDVSVQAQVINLLADLQRETGVAFLFIAHDLAVVEHVSHRVAVMYLGRIVEIADKADLYARPRHPYTRALLEAAPIPEPGAAVGRQILQGETPSPVNRPSGCHFRTRCPLATERCAAEAPVLRDLAPGHAAACHHADAAVDAPPASLSPAG